MNLPKIEEKILKFWEKSRIFEKSISQRKNRPYFSFYDGPPFATGKPHYGHILATTIKDVVLRYKTMQGYQVPRRVGWDCHGLPVENLIEKELDIKDKREIEKMGVEKFNQACRSSVFRCVEDFEKTLQRVGRWADYKEAYATLENGYIESVWWVLKQLWDQGLVYKDYRVSPYCPRCSTSLSNFEVNQGYQETNDPSVFVKFRVKSKKPEWKNVSLLAWTTTPWTLPSNTALAVNPRAEYVLAKQGKEVFVLAKKRKEILKGKYETLKKIKGKDLVGLEYEPLFDYLPLAKESQKENVFKALPASFVSLEEGTGIVHMAPMYGEDDFQLAKKFNLPLWHGVDESGSFKKEVRDFSGLFVKEADSEIIQNLLKRKLLYREERIWHSYPFCWRCDKHLLYYAVEGWYINVIKFKKELLANNKKIRWVPGHIKEGRFGKWLEGARDWNFSRSRFWGAPLPIWQCKGCDNIEVMGSVKELEKASQQKPKDLHRPYIDKIAFKCSGCSGRMERVLDVFDCWFESGSMPYGQRHYPFENKKLVEKTFPADFIAEGLDQTRGWFYTLHVLATALTLKDRGLGRSKPAFKNVIVNGLILDEKGRKLSKKLKNYPEPKEVFDSQGADSLRYFLLTGTPIGEDYRFSSKSVEEVRRRVAETVFNSHVFFETYCPKDFKPQKNFKPSDPLNKWIFSRLQTLNKGVVSHMDNYEITKASRLFNDFVDDFSNWYIRRSRKKLQRPDTPKEQQEFCQSLFWSLLSLSKLLAPFMPFLAEEIYLSLAKRFKKAKLPFSESVHLCDYPKPEKKLADRQLEGKMKNIRSLVRLALAERSKAGIKVRQPLARLQISESWLKRDKALLALVKEEVNVKEVVFGKELKLDARITPELEKEGIVREAVRQVQEMRKKAGLRPQDKALVEYSAEAGLSEILAENEKLILKEGNLKGFGPKKAKGFDFEKTAKVGQKELFLGLKK